HRTTGVALDIGRAVHGAGGPTRGAGDHRGSTALGRDLDHVLVAGLVGHGLIGAIGVDHQAGGAGIGARLQAGHRGGEVGDVQVPAQRLRDAGIGHVHDHARTLVAHVGGGTVAVEAQDDPARAVLAAAEVDVGDLDVRHDLLGRVGTAGDGAAGAGIHGQHQQVAGAAGGVG